MRVAPMPQKINLLMNQCLERLLRFSSQKHFTALKIAFENLSPLLFGLGITAIIHRFFYASVATTHVLLYGFLLFGFLLLISLSIELSKLSQGSWLTLAVLSVGSVSLLYVPTTNIISLHSFILIILSGFWTYGVQTVLSRWGLNLKISPKLPQRVYLSLLEMFTFVLTALLLWLMNPWLKMLMTPIIQAVVLSLSITHTLVFFIFLNSLNIYIWYKGYHGTNVLSNFVIPITTLTLILNMDAFFKGLPFPFIFAGLLHTLYGNYIIFNAIHIWIKLKAKSKHLKDLQHVGHLSTFFNINETLLFGLPLVKSKTMLKGFLLTNVLNMMLLFFALNQQWVSPLFVGLPFMVPAPLNVAFSSFSWNALLLWFGLMMVDILLLHPFLKKIDEETGLKA